MGSLRVESFLEGGDFLAELASDAVADDVHGSGGEAEESGDLADRPIIEGEQVKDLQVSRIQTVLEAFEGGVEELPTGLGFEGLIGIHGWGGAENGGAQGGPGTFLEGEIGGLPFSFAQFVVGPPAHQLEEPTAEGAWSAGDFKSLNGIGDTFEDLLGDVLGFRLGESATAGEAVDDAGIGGVESVPTFGIIEVAEAVEKAGVGIEGGVEELARVGCHGRHRRTRRPWFGGGVTMTWRLPGDNLQIAP